MSKYIDADLLREKLIERLGLFEELTSDTISPIRIDECKKIIGIIDSLQQEQPKVDLERIIEQTYHDGSVADTDDMDHATYENIARHFYELGQKDAANKFDEIEYNRQRAQEQEGQR